MCTNIPIINNNYCNDTDNDGNYHNNVVNNSNDSKSNDIDGTFE